MPDQRNVLRRTVWSKLSATSQSRVWTGLVASLPAAAAEFHNFVATVVADATRDRTYRCKKLADDSYAWVESDGGLGAHKKYTGGDVYLPASYSMVIDENYEIDAGDTFEIAAGASLAIL